MILLTMFLITWRLTSRWRSKQDDCPWQFCRILCLAFNQQSIVKTYNYPWWEMVLRNRYWASFAVSLWMPTVNWNRLSLTLHGRIPLKQRWKGLRKALDFRCSQQTCSDASGMTGWSWEPMVYIVAKVFIALMTGFLRHICPETADTSQSFELTCYNSIMYYPGTIE